MFEKIANAISGPALEYWGEKTSLIILIGTLLDVLPKIVAILALVFWAIRIYESDTVKDLIFKWRNRNSKKDYYDFD